MVFHYVNAQKVFDFVRDCNLDSLKVLVEQDPKVVNENGFNQLTPLHFAVGGPCKEVITYLLDRGADVNAKDSEGRTPLFFAAVVTGKVDISKLLIDKGADINAKDNSQRSILVWTVIRGFRELSEYLLDLGAQMPSANDKSSTDMLNSAVENGMTTIVDRLIAAGADVFVKDNAGNNLLHQAASGGSTMIIDKLIKAGIKINDTNNYGWTPLHYAAEGGFKETAAKLIENGVDINTRNISGFTAYNLATEIDSKDVIDLLTSKGADLSLPKIQRLKGEYFGMKAPGNIPELFAPGIISREGSSEYACTFSPDVKEFYFTKGSTIQKIMVSRLESDGWTFPKAVNFSKGYSAHEPHITFDNQRIFWGWFRPLPEGEKARMQNYGIYMSERIANGWSDAKYVGQGMFVSSSRDGRMYLTGNGLVEITIVNGRFASDKPLKGMDNIKTQFGGGAHPCIAPDGSYIVFDVNGGSYLFVSFRKENGTWGDAIDLTNHGFDPKAGIASISPDGKYLFFSLKGDIYWVSTKLIEELRPKEL